MCIIYIYIDEKTLGKLRFAPKMTLTITLLFETNAYLILHKENNINLILGSVPNSVNNINGKNLI